jgi:hypothetical protein
MPLELSASGGLTVHGFDVPDRPADVIVNGAAVVRVGVETGDRPRRLPRRDA